jgi:DNA-directed RNA polymerase specialized sigma24 family protein
MSVSDAIAPHIPFLRRFARALTGTQQSGDGYVAATLEAILAEPSIFDPSLSPRVALYSIFLRTWQSVPANNVVEQPASTAEAAAVRNLGIIPVAPRIAFLLSEVESFSIPEISQALGCSQAEVRDLIDQAGRGIAAQLRTKVLIIEDEPLIAMDLRNLMEQLGHEVATIARTHTEAVRAALSRDPGLILADIQLADGSSGLEAVNEILGHMEAPVIFITTFPERFLTGRAPEPAFLIAKPFSAESVKAVVSQALFFDRKSQPINKAKIAG